VKIVIVGAGRVGALLAESFDEEGHEVVLIDQTSGAFDKLAGSFGGSAVRGDGTDEDTLLRAGAEGADLFMAMTEGDNRNVMAAQLAHEALGAKQVIAKINDPVRAEAYADLGIATLCRTNMMADAVHEFLGLPVSGKPGIVAPTGSHPGGEHHGIAAAGTPAAATSSDRAAAGNHPGTAAGVSPGAAAGDAQTVAAREG
jgi:trk system potassium uptake protein TrkA